MRLPANIWALFFNLVLNPGHLIHIDEWLNTPVYPGSNEHLMSGQAIQCDIIPAVGAPYFSANIEDGVALLDDNGRGRCARSSPDVWGRIEARRAFMGDVLGIRLACPRCCLSNLAAAMPPFWLSPSRIFAEGIAAGVTQSCKTLAPNYVLAHRHLADIRPYAPVTGQAHIKASKHRLAGPG
jgi:hypothetical protein